MNTSQFFVTPLGRTLTAQESSRQSTRMKQINKWVKEMKQRIKDQQNCLLRK